MRLTTEKGFSLVEMLIVVALIGIMAGIATPLFQGYRQNLNLREAAKDLSSDISLYRQRAVAENIHYQITYNQPGNSYKVQVETASNSGIYKDLNPVVEKSPGTYGQVIISGATVASITLQPRGTMNPGSITLQHTVKLSTATITTNLTGRVYVTYNLL